MEEYEKEIEAARKDYETRHLTIDLLTFITIGVIVVVGIYLYFRYDKDPKLATKPSHINELPADYYTPAELGVFMNKGKVRPDYIVATLMDLINRGYLNIEPSEDDKYILSKNPDATATSSRPMKNISWLGFLMILVRTLPKYPLHRLKNGLAIMPIERDTITSIKPGQI